MSLHVRPITRDAANAFVRAVHRHHPPVVGCLFCTSAVDETGAIRGVAIVGRPVARLLQDGVTCEVTRLATDGARNACSLLYGAAWRAARAIGYRRIVTYTLESEGGASLRALGWKRIDGVGGGEWGRANRPRSEALFPTEVKTRWQAEVARIGGAS